MLGRINKLETFGSVDGPGVRFVVFMQGCPMRCQFCHNPETWDFGAQSANGINNGSFEISANDLLKKALRYQSYWGKDGGITVSGGEDGVVITCAITDGDSFISAGFELGFGRSSQIYVEMSR